MSKYIPDVFFSQDSRHLKDMLGQTLSLYLLVNEPRLNKLADMIARKFFEEPERWYGSMDQSFHAVTQQVLTIVKNPETRKIIQEGYTKMLDSRTKKLEKDLEDLKKIPKL
jgi:hypothetical protein